MHIVSFSYKTTPELLTIIGQRLKAIRIEMGLTQDESAKKAGVSLRAMQNLEAGNGSTFETFLRVFKAIDDINKLNHMMPEPEISPVAMFKALNKPKPSRVRHSRAKAVEE